MYATVFKSLQQAGVTVLESIGVPSRSKLTVMEAGRAPSRSLSSSQVISDAIKVSLSTDETSEVDAHSYAINPADELKYGFWVDQATEVISRRS